MLSRRKNYSMEWNAWTRNHEDSCKSMLQLKITAQKIKFFFSKCEQIQIFLRNCLNLLKKSLTVKKVLRAVNGSIFFLNFVVLNYLKEPLHKIWSFRLRISSVTVTKSLMENFIYCAVNWIVGKNFANYRYFGTSIFLFCEVFKNAFFYRTTPVAGDNQISDKSLLLSKWYHRYLCGTIIKLFII